MLTTSAESASVGKKSIITARPRQRLCIDMDLYEMLNLNVVQVNHMSLATEPARKQFAENAIAENFDIIGSQETRSRKTDRKSVV